MYLPRAFEERRVDVLLALMRSAPLATVVVAEEIAHVPLLADAEGPRVRLRGHVARANPLVAAIDAGATATAVFHGPDAYVSAGWYEQPSRQVPTWSYAAVHARGPLRRVGDGALRAILDDLAAAFEPEGAPWTPALLEPGLLDELLPAIVGFEVVVESLAGKLKLSQNRSDADRARVEAALSRSVSPRDRDVAAWMRRS